MKQDVIERWLQDERVIDECEVSPGYIVAVRQDGDVLGVYALSKTSIRLLTSALTLEEARAAITEYREWFTGWLEKRRKKEPTPAQLAMLFRWKVPIPLDLTFGQAWDIIDTRIKEDQAARAAARRAKLHLVPSARQNESGPAAPTERAPGLIFLTEK